jgi:hypothetical protein
MIVRLGIVVVHACNPSTWEAEAGGFGGYRPLSYIASLRPGWATYQGLVSDTSKQQNK